MYPDIFNDVFGPIMIGPSSSSSAGPTRIGLLARDLLGCTPKQARITFDPGGSFAGCYQGEGSDIGFIGGLMGWDTDDMRIPEALRFASEAGMKFQFVIEPLKETTHPNTVLLQLEAENGKQISVVADSIGGGRVRLNKINAFPVCLEGDSFVILVFYEKERILPSSIKQYLTDKCSVQAENILSVEDIAVEGEEKSLLLFRIEKEVNLHDTILNLPGVCEVMYQRPVLPVITSSRVKPPLFTSVQEMMVLSQQERVSCSEIAIRYEMDRSGWEREKIIGHMAYIWSLMKKSVHWGLEEDLKVGSNLRRPMARDYHKRVRNGESIAGSLIGEVAAMALAGIEAVDDALGVTVPGPSAGAAGIIPGALLPVAISKGYTDEQVVNALFVAGAIGVVAYTKTQPTGEVTGCSGETGIGSAMAAGALAALCKGNSVQIGHAASIALQNTLGLPCDPVAGCIQVPCYTRVVNAAINAVVSADLAMGGMDGVIPIDELIEAMDRMFKEMPANLKGTATGGTASCPTAIALTCDYKNWLKQKRSYLIG